MEKITQKPFEKKKKISLDINERFLNLIDDLSDLTKNSRSLIIESLIGQGIKPFFELLEDSWKGYLRQGKWGKKDIKDLLKNLKKIKNNYSWLDNKSF